MSNPIGSCGLCLRSRELKDSHLLPAASYKLSRLNYQANPNPVIVSNERSFTTSRQITAFFLCGDCENRFSRNGERFVLSQCARPNGHFRLRESLDKQSPIYIDSKYKVHDVKKVLGDQVNQYIYFAASIFWRASARQWFIEGRTLDLISLGSRYQEEFRRYLIGETAFPLNARIFIQVWSNNPVDFTTVAPCSYRIGWVKRHKFCIPGITFILFLGSEVPKKHDEWALNSVGGHHILVYPWEDDSLFKGFLTGIKKSRPTQHLRSKAGRHR